MLDKLLLAAAAGSLVLGAFSTSTLDERVNTAAAGAKTFKIDPGHSSAIFEILHLGTTPFFGRFNEVSGTIHVDEAKLAKSTIELEIPVASIDTNSKKRDAHLKQPDFFNAAEFPKMTFKSTRMKKKGKDKIEITGDLTIRGKTKEMTVMANYFGIHDLKKMGIRTGWMTEFTIDRHDFGVSWGKGNGALADEVKITIALEGILNAE